MLPIYYINLDRREDRRELMERQFAEIGLEAQRISATTINSISPADRARYCDPARASVLSLSQLACIRSHVSCWRAQLEADAPWVLVLEDDVRLSAQLPVFLAQFLAHPASTHYDLIQLETAARRMSVLPPGASVGETALRGYCSTLWGSAGYLISRRGAQAMLDRPDLFDAPVDQSLFRPYARAMRGLNVALADPALCIQLDKLEATPLAQGNLTPVVGRDQVPLAVRIQRAWRHNAAFAVGLAYRIRHISKGLRSEIIPFDTPEGRYAGSKLRSYGTELPD